MAISDRSNIIIPKIFVGTMYSGEAEFEECKTSIRNQQGVEISHFIIQNMPEFEAHNYLWDSWNKSKESHDLFIKVDADTLVDNPMMFSRIWEEFRKNPRLTGIQALLDDYFTETQIAGLNCFSPAVIFTPSNSRLHADHADRNHDQTLKGESASHLSPAGRHCAYPNRRQSFHYGLHRMKKLQRDTVRNVLSAWKRSGGEGRLFALYGAASALHQQVDNDYSSPDFEREFLKTEQIFDDEDAVRSLLKTLEKI